MTTPILSRNAVLRLERMKKAFETESKEAYLRSFYELGRLDAIPRPSDGWIKAPEEVPEEIYDHPFMVKFVSGKILFRERASSLRWEKVGSPSDILEYQIYDPKKVPILTPFWDAIESEDEEKFQQAYAGLLGYFNLVEKGEWYYCLTPITSENDRPVSQLEDIIPLYENGQVGKATKVRYTNWIIPSSNRIIAFKFSNTLEEI